MVENYNFKKNVENGIYREDNMYEGANGLIYMEKWNYLEVELAKDEKMKKIAEQAKINGEIIAKWSEKTMADVKQNPTAFFTEGKDSEQSNNA